METAHVHSIVYQPRDTRNAGVHATEAVGPFHRVPIDRVMLRESHGIEGDRKAGRSRKRQVNLLLREWLMVREREGYRIEPGAFGEQLVIAGLAGQSLRPGTRLQIGSTAVLELTMPRTGCERLQAAQRREDPLLLGHIGYLARVVASGVIAIGDVVLIGGL